MATKTGTGAAESGAQVKSKKTAPAANEVVALSEDERRQVPVRAREFPALYGAPEVEVAERSADVGEESTGVHRKEFVTLKRDYDIEGDAVHERNIRAVRQYMINQGLRPDAKVTFVGAEDHWDGKSVVLAYEVSAVPAVIATSFDTRHAVVGEDVTATERAEYDAGRESRLKAGWDARRDGTPEAERPAVKPETPATEPETPAEG